MTYPMNETYRWDPAEGIIGVLGVAPAATADFYNKLITLTPAQKDWEHVRVLIDSNPKLPSRGRHLELGETDPSPYLRMGIEELFTRGACVVAVPCNTAHILYARYATGLEASVPNMVQLAVSALVDRCERLPHKVAVLGSRKTLEHGLYQRELMVHGAGLIDMGPWQSEITALIEHVKQGGDSAAGAIRLKAAMASAVVAGADAFMIACTELSLLVDPADSELPVIDASLELARCCLSRARTSQHVLR